MVRTSVEQLLRESRCLRDHSDTPLLDSQTMLARLLRTTREWLLAHSEFEPDDNQVVRFRELLQRRMMGEPLAYITGEKGFWNHNFKVSAATLIPRPETELLIETILDGHKETELDILDLGTGSGAIAISLAAEQPGWSVTGIDRSIAALEVARENGANTANVRFLAANWCDAVADNAVDVIVSNPPYIRENDPHLKDLTFEPRLALTAGETGLDCLRQIITRCRRCLRPAGRIYLEHGYDQGAQVRHLLLANGFTDVVHRLDLQMITRVTTATNSA